MGFIENNPEIRNSVRDDILTKTALMDTYRSVRMTDISVTIEYRIFLKITVWRQALSEMIQFKY
jgi:hypothetical protein